MMTTTFNDFVKQLLYDVTLAGNEGIAAEELERAVRVFAESQRSSQAQQTTTNATNLIPANAQASNADTSDDALVEAVWNRLENHCDITIREPIDPEEPSSATAQDEDAQPAIPSSSPVSPSKHPGKRIFASRSRVCETIAGHPWNFRLLPNKEFDLLSIIAAHGPDGILQPDLRKLAFQDKRSVPKRTDDLAAKGYISKHKVMAASQQTAIVKLLRFSKEGMQGPKHVRAFPESTPTSSLRVIYYDVWFDNILRLLNGNGGIITMQDMRVGLGIHGSAWGRKALQRCAERLVEVGLVRKLKLKVDGETGQNSADCWMNCIQLLREPGDGDRIAFAGTHESDRTMKLKQKFAQPNNKDTEMSDDESGNESDDDVLSAEDIDDARTDESSTDDEQPTSTREHAPPDLSPEDRETTAVDRSGNVVSFRVTYTATASPDGEFEEWGFLKMPSNTTEGEQSEQRIFQWSSGDCGEIRPISELKHGTLPLSHRRSALLNWTPRKKARRNVKVRLRAMETNETSLASVNGAPKRTSDEAGLPDTGPPGKVLRVGEPETLLKITTANKASRTSRKAKTTSNASARSTPGLYVNPSDAQDTRFMERRGRGRRPKSTVLVFKLDGLKNLSWFRSEAAAMTNEPQTPMISASPTRETRDDEDDHHSWTEQRRGSTTSASFSKKKGGRPRTAGAVATQDQNPGTSDVEQGPSTGPKVTSTLAQDSSPYDTAPAFSTRRSRPRSSSLASPAAPTSQRSTETELPAGTVATISPPNLTSTKVADDGVIPSNPLKKRKRGRPSKADIAERERLMLEGETTGKSLIVRLPVTLPPSPEHLRKKKKTETPSVPVNQEGSLPQAMSNHGDPGPSQSLVVSLSLPRNSLSRKTNDVFETPTKTGLSYVQPDASLYDAVNRDSPNNKDGAGAWKGSPSKIVKLALPTPSQNSRGMPNTAMAMAEPMQNDHQASVLRTISTILREASGPVLASVNSDMPSPLAAEQLTFKLTNASHGLSEPLTPTVESNDRAIQGPNLRRSTRRDSAGFPRIEGLTVRRTAAGLAISHTEPSSDLEADSPIAQPAVPTPRKRRTRQVSQRKSGTKSNKRVDGDTICRSLLMAPAQYFHGPSGTIGTVGIFEYTGTGVESLQLSWKKHHALPKDLQDILNDAKKPESGRLKGGEEFHDEVERVRIWEEGLVNEGCFIDAKIGSVFINHASNSGSTFPPQNSDEAAEFKFVPERLDVPNTKAKASSMPRRKSTRTRLPSRKGAALIARNDSSFEAQNAYGLAALFPGQDSPTTGLQQIQTRSSSNGSISGLYPGPDLPKVPLLPLSRYWTLPNLNEELSDGRAIVQSESHSEPEASARTTQQAQGQRNTNGGEKRTTRSKPSHTSDDHERTEQRLTSQSGRCDRCSKLNKPCGGGSATERCGTCKRSHALCSKVDADRLKLERWGRKSTEELVSETEPEATSIFQDRPNADVSLAKLLESMSSGSSTTTPSTPIQQGRKPSKPIAKIGKQKPSVSKAKKPGASGSPRLVDTGNNPVITNKPNRQTRIRNDAKDLNVSLRKRASSSTSAGLRAIQHSQRLCIAVVLAMHLCSGAESSPDPNWDVIEHALSFKYDKVTLQQEWTNQKAATSDFMKKLEDAFKPAFLIAYEKDEISAIDLEQSNEVDRADWPALVQWVEQKVLPLVEDEGTHGEVGNQEDDRNGLPDDLTSTMRGSQVRSNVTFHDLDDVPSPDANEPHMTPDLVLPGSPHYRNRIKARSWVRALVMTEDKNYNREMATQKLQGLGDDVISQAVADLEREGMILRKKAGRQVSGRNHRISKFTLSQFARWPSNNEQQYLRHIADARTRIVELLDGNHVYDINSGFLGADSLILDSMVDHGRLKRVLDIMGIKAQLGSSQPTDIPVYFLKTDKYTSDHGLACNVLIPTQPSAPFDAAIPFWVDIHGHLLDDVWDMVLHSTLHVLVYQPGVTVKGIKTAHKGQLFSWEIELLLDWMEKTGLAEKTVSINGQNASVDAGWRASEWWYCAFLPEVAKWKQPGGSLQGEEEESGD